MAIEFGIFDHVDVTDGTPAVDVYEDRIALVKAAEAGGFYAYHLAEHHGHSLSIAPAAAVFLAALARETTTLKLIPSVVCLPLHNPVRLFEELTMLDVLSNGRVELGLGKGITPFEHLMFGHDPSEAAERSREMIPMLLEAWKTGVISSEASKYYDFLEMKLPYEPVQRPYPPLWTAGNVETAGRLGHNFITPRTMPEQMRSRYDELRAAATGSEPGYQSPLATEPRIAQSQGVVIADTDAEAEAIARRAWKGYVELLMRAHGNVPPHKQEGLPEMDNPIAEMQLRMDPIESGLVIAGTAEKVRQYYVDTARQGLANYFMIMLYGEMSHDEVWGTQQAFIDEVIPAVREVEAVGASR